MYLYRAENCELHKRLDILKLSSPPAAKSIRDFHIEDILVLEYA